MNKIALICLVVYFFPVSSNAQLKVDEATVRAISSEFTQATINGDFSVFRKYLYQGTEIVMDLDPDPNKGKQQMSYEVFMQMTEAGLELMSDVTIDSQVLSVTEDRINNQATIEEKTSSKVHVLGIVIEEVSVNKTTYGVVDGQIKALKTENELIRVTPQNNLNSEIPLTE